MDKSRVIALRLPPEWADELQAQADAAGLTLGQVVRAIVAQHMRAVALVAPGPMSVVERSLRERAVIFGED
jgi:hypothetical protein